MSKSKDDAALNQHIEELREKMGILKNDRKSNMDIIEANKNQNKEEMKRLREENKEFRVKLSQLQRLATTDGERDEKKFLEKEIERLRRLHDETKVKANRERSDLEQLRDQVRDLELDCMRPHMEDNSHTRNIRSLENKLDKAMIKYNEAQSIRKTYEQIVRRLNEERVGFDNQLKAIERTLSAKSRDHDELLLLAGDAHHAKEVSLNELDRVRAGYEEERKKRERELRERHQVVQLRRQMLERIKMREKMRETLESKADGDDTGALSAATQKMIANERIEARNKIDIFENAFRKIKEATGVSDVNEVISKIMSQEGTTESLIQLTRENQLKLETLADERRRIKNKVEELKFSGVSGGARRKLIDDQEDQLSGSISRLERSRLKYDRLSKLIIAMKAGIGHLQDKLESVREELNAKHVELSDDTVVDVLRESEVCLTNVYRRIKAAEDSKKRDRMTNAGYKEGSIEGDSVSQRSLDAEELTSNRPYNQRIDLNNNDDDDDFNFHDDDNGLEDDELTRDKVKRASTQILLSVDRKRRKPKKVAANAGDR